MSLMQKVQADLKQAMLSKDELARETLRMLKAELLKREVDLGRDLVEAEEVAVLKSAVKTRQDSIASYEEAGRADAAARERAEIAIVERYLPKQLGEAETRAAIATIVNELGITSKKDMGRVMKELMARYQGQVDGKLASKLAGEALS